MKQRKNAVPIVDTATLTEDEWKEYRKHGVGASDVPAIMGLSPFKTVIRLFSEKVSRKPIEEIEQQVAWRRTRESAGAAEAPASEFGALGTPVIDCNSEYNLTTEVGHALEPVIGKYISCKLGLPVFQDTTMYRHPDHPFLFVNLDYIMLSPDDNGELKRLIVIECKTATYWKKEAWEQGVPTDYEMQCRAAMAVLDVDEVIIVCLLDNNEGGIFTYSLYRDHNTELQIIMAVKKFWDNVLTETLPIPPLPSKQAAAEMAVYAREYPKQEFTPELFEEGVSELAHDFCRQYRVAKEKEEEYLAEQEKVDTLKLRLSAYMVDKDKTRTGPLSLSWVHKKQHSIDFDALRLAYPDIYAKLVKEKETPYFNVHVNKKKLEAMDLSEETEVTKEAA